ncbi:hypothetical protein NFJ02_15g20700 [Pycnococcus provasolii]
MRRQFELPEETLARVYATTKRLAIIKDYRRENESLTAWMLRLEEDQLRGFARAQTRWASCTTCSNKAAEVSWMPPKGAMLRVDGPKWCSAGQPGPPRSSARLRKKSLRRSTQRRRGRRAQLAQARKWQSKSEGRERHQGVARMDANGAQLHLVLSGSVLREGAIA